MTSVPKNFQLYLEKHGLIGASPERIEKARVDYMKEYNREAQRKLRQEKKILKFSVTPSEFTGVDRKAMEYGFSKPGAFAKMVTLNFIGKEQLQLRDEESIQRLEFLLRNAATNINEATKKMHTYFPESPMFEEFKEMKRQVVVMEAALSDFMRCDPSTIHGIKEHVLPHADQNDLLELRQYIDNLLSHVD